jgi:hypothetical protein
MLLKDESNAIEGMEAWKKDVDAWFFHHNLPFL